MNNPDHIHSVVQQHDHIHSVVQHNYHDHAKDDCDLVLSSDNTATTTTTRRATSRGGVSTPFPIKLHHMLDRIEEDGHADIVSWQPHGRCFVVFRKKEFSKLLLQKYFKLSKMASFIRQLNLYGFQRITQGRDKGGYYHEYFLRNRLYLAYKINRIKVKGTKVRARSNPSAEPNFWEMSWISGAGSSTVAHDTMGGSSSTTTAIPQQCIIQGSVAQDTTGCNGTSATTLPQQCIIQSSVPRNTTIGSGSTATALSQQQCIIQNSVTQDTTIGSSSSSTTALPQQCLIQQSVAHETTGGSSSSSSTALPQQCISHERTTTALNSRIVSDSSSVSSSDSVSCSSGDDNEQNIHPCNESKDANVIVNNSEGDLRSNGIVVSSNNASYCYHPIGTNSSMSCETNPVAKKDCYPEPARSVSVIRTNTVAKIDNFPGPARSVSVIHTSPGVVVKQENQSSPIIRSFGDKMFHYLDPSEVGPQILDLRTWNSY